MIHVISVDPTTDPRVLPTLDAYASDMAALVGVYAHTIRVNDLEGYRAPRGVFLLGIDGDMVVGCGAFRPYALRDGSEGVEIKRMWVTPEARGTGLGRRILAELHRRAAERGVSTAVLDTRSELVAANRLYRSFGYEPCDPYNLNPDADTWMSVNLLRITSP